MSEHDESIPVRPPVSFEGNVPDVSQDPSGLKPFSYWLKRFLACNPFYLISAGMLLFGLYRVSIEPGFLAKETAQLAFNFSSLQCYEMLLIGTAIFLARRKIWYDSTLLVGLENLLLLVPFILISQAALIDRGTVGWISILAGTLVALRFSTLKRFFGELNLPTRTLLFGIIIVATNIAMLVLHRSLQETRSSKWGMAYEMNEYCWLLVMPAVVALGTFLPNAKEVGALLPQRRWLPSGFFGLWLIGSAVHLYCLSYIYQFDLRRELIVPSLWVLAWTMSRRISDFIVVPGQSLKRALLILPVIAALASVQNQNKVFLVLTLLNAAIFGVLYLLKKDQRFVRHLLFASVVMLIAGLPVETVRFAMPHAHRGNYLAAGVAVYLVLCTLLSRNPRLGLIGALVASAVVAILAGREPMALHWAIQTGFLFLLLHSLRWDNALHNSAAKVRNVAAILWSAHAFLWMHFGGDWWMACVVAAMVLAACLILRLFQGHWEFLLLPASAVLVVLSGPGNLLVGLIRMAPSGLVAVAGSFLIFAIGTAMALNKHRWHQVEAKN